MYGKYHNVVIQSGYKQSKFVLPSVQLPTVLYEVCWQNKAKNMPKKKEKKQIIIIKQKYNNTIKLRKTVEKVFLSKLNFR